jgi:metal-responsive CopG/Arc/MetJ family transcriptional regulator
MEEKRSEKISIQLAPSLLARLDAYARQHRWSRSNAVAALIDTGLQAEQGVLDAGR